MELFFKFLLICFFEEEQSELKYPAKVYSRLKFIMPNHTNPVYSPLPFELSDQHPSLYVANLSQETQRC